MFLDANVLIAAFSPRDAKHSDSLGFIENPSMFEVDQWIVPVVVIVEAWGMLVKGGNDHRAGQAMLAWLRDPGNPALIVRFAPEAMELDADLTVERIVQKVHVDVVDAVLVITADRVSKLCDIPALYLATYDHKDFPRLRTDLNASVRIFDMVTFEGQSY